MKNLLAILAFTVCIHSAAHVDFLDLIQDTYGEAWNQMPNNITNTLWELYLEDTMLQQRLQSVNPGSADYEELQGTLRDLVQNIESIFKSSNQIAQGMTAEKLIDTVYGKPEEKKPNTVTLKTLDILANNVEFQELLKTNPAENTEDYYKLINILKETVDDVEFWLASIQAQEVIVKQSKKLYPQNTDFQKTITSFRYLKNFSQELVKGFNQAAQEPDFQQMLVESWIEEQYRQLNNRLQSIQGIINEKNSCYQNSLFQIIKYAGSKIPMSKELLSKFKALPNTDLLKFFNATLLPEEQFIKISRDYPTFKNQLNQIFAPGEQQDPEYLFDLLIHQKNFGGKPNELAPLLSKAFEFTKHFDHFCKKCKKQDYDAWSLNKIDLSLTTTGYDLKSLIQNSLAPEILNCTKCDGEKTDQQRTTIIPEQKYLLIQMPIRYKTIITQIDGFSIKEDVIDDNMFQIPQVLYFTNQDLFISPPAQKSKWNLIGVVAHYGSLNGGHYISLVNKQGKWLKCDDTNIIPISPFAWDARNGYNTLKKLEDEQGVAKPYLLFYERI
ncbi:MAG: Ubiquitin carboxyl-terminal hydrolase [candidate division TM6 bacterium GW2011_GWF2_43_17]|nr:MAG: Ubiquitin carboxyl-terminal hydrolase [candidate division TM6 bacterium GW2011_GWF2_43_17]HAU30493.1 hypothetical protein [Candidatus Dependentiae bacterium]